MFLSFLFLFVYLMFILLFSKNYVGIQKSNVNDSLPFVKHNGLFVSYCFCQFLFFVIKLMFLQHLFVMCCKNEVNE